MTVNATGNPNESLDWFEELSRKRQSAFEANKENGFNFSRLLVDKYTDPAHFVYELLQNAEDQRATNVRFNLGADQLVFEHNGVGDHCDVFTKQDVESITSIGNSQKSNKIGQFGIGFKSVFDVTPRPEIYTSIEGKPFGFAIENLYVPKLLNPRSLQHPVTTQFVFPFHRDKSAHFCEIIHGKLRSIGADSMLFLDFLEHIAWETQTDNGNYICERKFNGKKKPIDVRLIDEHGNKSGAKEIVEQEYIQFFKKVELILPNRDLTVSIAFRMDEGKIIPEPTSSVLNVYFPTREQTNLHFRIHAPMLLSDNRANIKESCAENRQLIQASSELLAESLVSLRDNGLLSVSALSCLPIETGLWESCHYREWAPMWEAVKEAMTSQALIPTGIGTYVTSKNARLAGADWLRKLIDCEQLGRLVGSNEPCFWLSSDITESGKLRELWTYIKAEIGVIGPARLNYARVIPLVDYTAKVLGRLLNA